MSENDKQQILDKVTQPDPASTTRGLKMITFHVPAQTDPQLLKLISQDRIEFQLVAVLPGSEHEDISNRFQFTYVMHAESGDG